MADKKVSCVVKITIKSEKINHINNINGILIKFYKKNISLVNNINGRNYLNTEIIYKKNVSIKRCNVK